MIITAGNKSGSQLPVPHSTNTLTLLLALCSLSTAQAYFSRDTEPLPTPNGIARFEPQSVPTSPLLKLLLTKGEREVLFEDGSDKLGGKAFYLKDQNGIDMGDVLMRPTEMIISSTKTGDIIFVYKSERGWKKIYLSDLNQSKKRSIERRFPEILRSLRQK